MLSARSLSLLAACVISATVSAQVTIVNTAPGTFVDISTTGGTALVGVGDDTGHTFTTTIGNDLFPAGTVLVGSNGYACSPGTGTASAFGNVAITPTLTSSSVTGSTATGRVLCPLWDDLYMSPVSSTTIYWQELNGVLYIMWKDIGHYSNTGGAGNPAVTFEIQVFPGDCSGSTVQFLYPDATFGGAQAANDAGLSATVGCINFGATTNNAQWSFNTASVPDGTVLTLSKAGVPSSQTLFWTSPGGAGTLQMNTCAGPQNGQYLLAVTFNPGSFPNGWLYGIDISLPELVGQIGVFPFQGPLDGSGSFQLGPFGGLPSGLTFYSVIIGLPAGSAVPSTHSSPKAYTIP